MGRFGVIVGHALRDSGSDDPEVMKQHVAKKLKPHRDELMSLYTEVMPKVIRNRHDKGDYFEDLFSKPERVRILKSFGDGWDARLSGDEEKKVVERQLQFRPALFPTTTRHSLALSEEIIGAVAAMFQEAECLLHMVRPMTKIFPGAKDLNVNPMMTSGVGFGAAASGISACFLDAYEDEGNPFEAILCPLQSAGEIFDMFRQPLAMIGLLGDNNPSNGKQGNHNGGNERQGTLDDYSGAGDAAKDAKGKWPACFFWGNCGHNQ